jgi:hypothetical protein
MPQLIIKKITPSVLGIFVSLLLLNTLDEATLPLSFLAFFFMLSASLKALESINSKK